MKRKSNRILQSMAGMMLALGFTAAAQTPAPAAPPAPTPLSTFVLSGPLQWLPPADFDAGPFGKLSVNGIISGYAQGQNNPVPGDDTKQATLSNGEVFVQKADGKVQYFVQAGMYDFPTIGSAFVNTQNTVNNLFGPVPVAFVKIATGKTTTWEAGALPTLMGAEGAFTYQNMNISRGLLWFQENIINRGLQVNQALGKYFSASLSWNDGYYSDRYSWLSGSLTFTKGASTLVYTGMGNLSQTAYQTAATPVQNNSVMHAVVYTYTKGPWIATGTYQYSSVPTNPAVGVIKGATTNGFGAYLSKSFRGGFALPIRFEYLAQSGSLGGPDVNLLYGPGSSATSFTVTPTYQKGGFFFRTDLGYVHAMNSTPGDVFGPMNTQPSQFRAVGEFGFILGNNITKE